MSYADKVFIDMCKDILTNGTDTRGQAVRPHWPDGESAYTIKKFGVVNRYDLRKEFPAITLRKTAIKSAMEEILWIFQKKSNNINDFNLHIWDEWANKEGSIGKAYGYQIGQRYNHHKDLNISANIEEGKYKDYPSALVVPKTGEVYLDQIDAVIYDLKHTPFSRRIMMHTWNFNDLHEMNLQPCCWSMTFNVTDEGKDKLILNMILNQRSNDVLAANSWNTVQYALLLMMIAQVCNMEAGELVHVITDAHIYDRHVDIIKEIIERPTFDAPKVWLNPNIKNFYDFRVEDLFVEDYKVGGPQVIFEVAI